MSFSQEALGEPHARRDKYEDEGHPYGAGAAQVYTPDGAWTLYVKTGREVDGRVDFYPV